MEVYLPANLDQPIDSEVDWGRLQERWVGWGVECANPLIDSGEIVDMVHQDTRGASMGRFI